AASIYQGGDWVTQRLAEEMAVTFEEAEEVKLNPDPAHQPAVDSAYDDFLSSMSDSLERTLLAQSLSQGDSGDISEVVLGGNCARLPRVTEYLANKLGATVRLANPFEHLATAFSVPAHVAGPMYHVAAGLALAASYRGKAKLDFERAVRQRQEPRHEVRGAVTRVFVALLVLLALALGNLYYKLHTKETQYQTLTERVNALYAATFPDVPLVVDAKRQMTAQVQRIEDELKKLDGLNSHPRRMLRLLHELSMLTPEELGISISDLNLANQRMRVVGEASSFDAVDTLRAKLAESEQFDDPVIDSAKANKR
ncbi:MAG: pilus assembly protein PilM, partial [Anaerolineae bacterium]|nr:pilus assembly protein PilM [Anaerolineae bacterium]